MRNFVTVYKLKKFNRKRHYYKISNKYNDKDGFNIKTAHEHEVGITRVCEWSGSSNTSRSRSNLFL